jgi:hypothetical protein
MARYLTAFVLAVALLAPAAITAQDHDRDQQAQYHQWNDHEDQVWHQWLRDHHKKDHDWGKATKKEQREYWKWRDAHPDRH